ncbi:hypothetical protein Taro_049476 [Colocasia esculenta]|uniref:Uncharacterized protein n=1 Tax=Colocasia esculenta TaxID=4460 RepID=A0A843XB81_COLES|nr:hypothetical protein [Colocasia esculenta]
MVGGGAKYARSLTFVLIFCFAIFPGIESSGILKLPELVRLDLSFNKFAGPLPAEIARMKKGLDLSYNNLSGFIPSSIGNLKSLLWLMLANNSLSGDIPPEIGTCRSLLWLNLANNQLSGGIPRSIAGVGSDPRATIELNREGRLITGPGDCLMMRRWIPADYPPFRFMYAIMTRERCRGTLDILRMGYGFFPLCRSKSRLPGERSMSGYLQLTGNRLTGEIPPEIGRMSWLSVVQLGHNGLSGRLPPEIGQLSLLMLNVSSNQFSGPIPPEIGGMQCLINLDLSSNNFSGEIPLSLSNLSEMSRFNVSFNPLLQGRIPATGQLAAFGEDSYLGNPLLVSWSWSTSPPPPTGWSPPEGEGRSSPWRSGPFFVSLGAAVGYFPVGFVLGTRLYSKKISPCLARRRTRRRRRAERRDLNAMALGVAFLIPPIVVFVCMSAACRTLGGLVDVDSGKATASCVAFMSRRQAASRSQFVVSPQGRRTEREKRRGIVVLRKELEVRVVHAVVEVFTWFERHVSARGLSRYLCTVEVYVVFLDTFTLASKQSLRGALVLWPAGGLEEGHNINSPAFRERDGLG